MKTKTKALYLILLGIFVLSCNRVDLPEPQIHNFSIDRATFPKRDTVTYTIDAEGDFITFYDGKQVWDISSEEMPYEHIVGRIRFKVTPPADTVWAKLAVTNVYDTDNISTVEDSIKLILLD